MNLADVYLLDRGVTLATAAAAGVELDLSIDRSKIIARLGKDIELAGKPLSATAKELIWFPVRDVTGIGGTWICRPLPTIDPQRKFLCPVGSSGPPFISKATFLAKAGRPLIITEGPVKTLACTQVGYDAIGLNGVWCAAAQAQNGKLLFRHELASALDWRGRKVGVCFDADGVIKPDVRHAMIRLFFLLTMAGAEIYQLTSWNLSEAKGVDDYLVGQALSNGSNPADVLTKLWQSAPLFLSTINAGGVDTRAVVAELENVYLSDVIRDQLCRALGKQLGVTTDLLRAIGAAAPANKNAVAFNSDPEPWPDPVNGEDLLDRIAALIRRHVVLKAHDLVTVSLWIVLTYLCDVADTLPLLAIVSPDKRCGKTSLLGVLSRLVKRPLPTSNVSPAALYRAIERFSPTLLVDEADAFLRDNEELRGVLNSGHTHDAAFVLRANRETGEVETFSTWGPKAVALIGKLPGTLSDRSLVVSMTRRKPEEKIDKLRKSSPTEFEDLRRCIVRWIKDNKTVIASANPQIPQKLNDRAGDNWFPLLAITQAAGPSWHDLALKAIAALPADDDEDSVVTVLLLSLRGIFRERGFTDDADFLPTDEILKELNDDKEAPWADWRKGLGISAHKLGRILKNFGVYSIQKQINNTRTRGYEFGKLRPVFERYLSTP